MPTLLKILAVLFFLLAAAALFDGASKVLAWHQANTSGHTISREHLSTLGKGLFFIWLFAAIYGVVGMGLWQRRRLFLVTAALLLILVGQWMNVGYPTAFILSFLALITLAFPAARSCFRN